ncbi:hypothetical protein NPX13_g6983 [Xylaria arbuscula]|uniref:Uncharacterized protein n=1 Tax=Xylaria arbuscula TaxID=114810 RepID=A0A9W8NBF1_9PEZI|nr:hypothetical protein NPX13_g6983 [Xylaria arbuscula]
MAELAQIHDGAKSSSSWLTGIQSWLSAFLHGHQKNPGTDTEHSGPDEDMPEKQMTRPAPYVPQHAGASFSRTATPREMRRQNEIL